MPSISSSSQFKPSFSLRDPDEGHTNNSLECEFGGHFKLHRNQLWAWGWGWGSCLNRFGYTVYFQTHRSWWCSKPHPELWTNCSATPEEELGNSTWKPLIGSIKKQGEGPRLFSFSWPIRDSQDGTLQQSLLTRLWMYQHAEGRRALQVHHERHEFCSRNMFIKIWTKESSARHFPTWYRHLPHCPPTFTLTSSHKRGRGWYTSLIIKICMLWNLNNCCNVL